MVKRIPLAKKSVIIFFSIVFSFSSFAFSQDKLLDESSHRPPVHHAPDREFHAVNIDLSFKFDLQKKEVFGTAVEKIVPLRAELDSVHLDAVDMTIDKVMMRGKNLGFSYNGNTLSIGLGKDYGLNDTLTFAVVYSTYPKKGIFFVSADKAYPNRTPQVWSQSEMEDARYWFPCHDYPDDFLTSSTTTTVPEDWTVVSNGVLEQVRTDKKDRTKTFRWVESKPHVIYLISIAAGKYSIVDDHYGSIPIYYYVAPEYAKYAKENFSHTPDILKFFSHVTGYEYPWQKLSLVAVTDFTFGGMENVSAITLTDRTMHDVDAEPQETSTDLVSHETAHQWFGDLLTCRTWGNAWLNEGFATYFEALYGEHAFGENHFNYEMHKNQQEVIDADHSERRPTVYNRYNDPVDLFSVYIYPRGADILHMLRGILGDQLFFKAIKYYVHDFQHKNVDTHDFANAVREATGYNLNWFFDEWAYKAGHPIFDVNYGYDSGSHSLTMHVEQTQKVDSLTPVYRMPVDIYIVTPSQKITKTIWVDSLSNTYIFDVPEKPLMVNFDEGNHLLKELNFRKSLTELGYQIKNDPNVAGRVWAAGELSGYDTSEATNALIGGLKDNFWGVRLECVNALTHLNNEEVEKALESALEDSDARVQEAVIDGLGKYKDSTLVQLIEKEYKTNRNYFVRAAAVKALTSIEGAKAMPIIEDAMKQDSYEQVIKIAGLQSLGTIDSSKGYDAAVSLSKYGVPHSLRLRAMSEMVQLEPKNEQTLSLLKQYVSDPYIWARMVAISSLGRVGDRSVVPLLQEREKAETDGRLKQAARRAIESLNKRASGE
jgi:aminopeptidase N